MVKTVNPESILHCLLDLLSLSLAGGRSRSIHPMVFPTERNVEFASLHSHSHLVTSSRRLRHDDFLEDCRTPPFFTDFSARTLGLVFGALTDSIPWIRPLTKLLMDSRVKSMSFLEIFTLSNFPSLAHFSTVLLSTLNISAASSGVNNRIPARSWAAGFISSKIFCAAGIITGNSLTNSLRRSFTGVF